MPDTVQNKKGRMWGVLLTLLDYFMPLLCFTVFLVFEIISKIWCWMRSQSHVYLICKLTFCITLFLCLHTIITSIHFHKDFRIINLDSTFFILKLIENLLLLYLNHLFKNNSLLSIIQFVYNKEIWKALRKRS